MKAGIWGSSKITLEELHAFLIAEGGVLSLRPHLLLQQAANQREGPALASASLARLSAGGRPWLRRFGNDAGGPCLTTLSGHEWQVTCCAWSADGKTIVSGAHDFTLRLWEAATGRQLAAFSGRGGQPKACAFSPDSRWIASAIGRELILWDPADDQSHRFPGGHQQLIMSLAFFPDGRTIATTSLDHTIKLWDIASRTTRFTLSGHDGTIRSCAFSPGGDLLLSASDDGTLRLWDCATATQIALMRPESRAGEIRGIKVSACAFSPDGSHAVSGDTEGRLRLWSIERRVQVAVARLTVDGSPLTCRFSPGGDQIAVAVWGDPKLRIWDAALTREVATLSGHSRHVNACAFSPDGKRIVTASEDHTLKIWDVVAADTSTQAAPERWQIQACAFSPDGTRLASGSLNKALTVWDCASGKSELVLSGHEWGVLACRFSPDGGRIISTSEDGSIRVWDATTGSMIAKLRGHRRGMLAVAPDFSRVVAWSREGAPGMYDLDGGGPMFALPPLEPVNPRVRFSPDGSLLVATTAESGLAVCDASSGRVIARVHQEGSSADTFAFTPDGARIISTAFGGLYLWDAETGNKLDTLEHFPDVCAIADDGGSVIVASLKKPPRLWDARSATWPATFPAEAAAFRRASFSSAAPLIAAATSDGAISLWNAARGTLVHEYFFPAYPAGGTAMAWRSDGGAFAVGTDGGDVLIEMRQTAERP